MERSNIPVTVSAYGSQQDRVLYDVKEALEQTYWSNPAEGVFNFQFISDDSPLTNVVSPYRFQLLRLTPDLGYEAYQTYVPGQLNNDGSFEYGGGRLGVLTPDGIRWKDGALWTAVNAIIPRSPDLLNLAQIKKQAYLDSKVMSTIYDNRYLY